VKPISFTRHCFPADVIRHPSSVIRHAVWLYFRFSLSFRDVEELLAQRGIEVSYEMIRCWTVKFAPPTGAVATLAPRRNGLLDRWRAHVSVARGR
jgi:putative transposase